MQGYDFLLRQGQNRTEQDNKFRIGKERKKDLNMDAKDSSLLHAIEKRYQRQSIYRIST